MNSIKWKIHDYLSICYDVIPSDNLLNHIVIQQIKLFLIREVL